ncbi:hypothetical protein [Chryseobacterium sp. POE27]|uniref:hypothetical protein n=1 Tax=Chryseobacterium sp. POE27 TaxID=3138177 RepID=UPI00321B47FA
MQRIFIILLFLLFVYTNAQIGIKKANPVGALDINGDLNVRSSLRTGGTNTVQGNAGVAGRIFHNNADLPVNDWKEIKIADGQGSMSVFFINTATDQNGVRFTEDGNSVPYTENSEITPDWKVLNDTEYTFSVSNAVNKIVFTFQTTAQKMGNGNSSSGFACGIYLDNKLKAVRTDVLLGPEGSYKIFNLNATLTNIPPKNNYSVKAACIKRTLNGGTLGIGTPATDNNPYLNATMSQSILTTSVLQSYQ